MASAVLRSRRLFCYSPADLYFIQYVYVHGIIVPIETPIHHEPNACEIFPIHSFDRQSLCACARHVDAAW